MLLVIELGIYYVVLVGFEVGNCNVLVFIVFEVIVVDFLDDFIFIQGDDLFVVFGFESYQWYFDGEFIVGVMLVIYMLQFSGIYIVEIIDVNGCICELEVLIIVSIMFDFGLVEVCVMFNFFCIIFDFYLEVNVVDIYQLWIFIFDGKLVWEIVVMV